MSCLVVSASILFSPRQYLGINSIIEEPQFVRLDHSRFRFNYEPTWLLWHVTLPALRNSLDTCRYQRDTVPFSSAASCRYCNGYALKYCGISRQRLSNPWRTGTFPKRDHRTSWLLSSSSTS